MEGTHAAVVVNSTTAKMRAEVRAIGIQHRDLPAKTAKQDKFLPEIRSRSDIAGREVTATRDREPAARKGRKFDPGHRTLALET